MPGAFAVRNDGKPLQRGMEADAIVVYVPTKVLETGALCDSNLEVKYARNHKTYKPVQERTAPVRCGLADYYLAVDLAVRKAAGPAETIVSIDTLPIRGLRSPVVIQNEKGTFHAYSLTFPDDPSGYGSISFDREGLTPSQCVARAESAPVNRTEVPIPQEKLKEFVDHLEKIDLRSDHCTRYKNGKCALFLDGMYYRVQVGSNDPIALFEFGNYRVRSENPALYAWTKSLLEEVATDLNTQQ